MNEIKWNKDPKSRFSFPHLSIQQRLPLLICILLLSVIITFSLASYIGVKKAAFEIGKDRLNTLTEQLSSMLGQSAQTVIIATRAAATQEPVKKYLQSGGNESDSAALKLMQNLRLDSSWILVELLNAYKQSMLRSGITGINIRLNLDSIISSLPLGPDSCKVGKIYPAGDSMYYPIIATVFEKKQVIGYLVRWKVQKATAQSIAQFSQLLGANAMLYIGNADGSLWTNLINPVTAPPIDTKHINNFFEYSREGNRVIATARPIANTQWLVLIEVSQQTVLEAANRFLRWVIIIGAVLVIVGIFIAWLMSRNITRPLNKLSAAASAIAGGDYSSSVEIHRKDELGKLARAFNTMAAQVNNAQQNLEKKVQERTAQLETANKELEAFSYSVSHDLRAPLRAVSGYSMILKEDYGTKLNAEANRITDTIISNANMMGQLIDDLIAFSKIGKKDNMQQRVNMKEIAESCMTGLLQHEPENKYYVLIDLIPDCIGDENLIRQVWTNLISNALKYSSNEPEPRIEIGYKETGSNNIYFIRDNGVGFDMQYGHKLFGVFQRLHSQEAFEGNGIVSAGKKDNR
jgi:signal transduction histidine kinase